MHTATSTIQRRGSVTFPPLYIERHYMVPFLKKEGLPSPLEHWQGTVDQMLDGIDTDQPMYIMVDSRMTKRNRTFRRPGAHIDGHWIEEIRAYDEGGGHTQPTAPGHHPPGGTHSSVRAGQRTYLMPNGDYPEAVLMASNLLGAVAYVGEFPAVWDTKGGVQGVDLSSLTEVPLTPYSTWAGNVSMLHDSLAFGHSVHRQLVRINVPGWEPQ